MVAAIPAEEDDEEGIYCQVLTSARATPVQLRIEDRIINLT